MPVLLRSHDAQVGPPVVEGVPVDVVHNLARLGIHEELVQIRELEFAVSGHEPGGIARAGQEPGEVFETGVVGSVHARDVAALEGNMVSHEGDAPEVKKTDEDGTARQRKTPVAGLPVTVSRCQSVFQGGSGRARRSPALIVWHGVGLIEIFSGQGMHSPGTAERRAQSRERFPNSSHQLDRPRNLEAQCLMWSPFGPCPLAEPS